ncbi:hypothetical protein T439DRAFT_349413 [Meredithblackwellia eburnea MCA 4105]
MVSMTVREARAILEIDESSSLEDAKSSYKKLALKHHPDKNPDTKEESTILFQKISTAFEVLTEYDEEQRNPRPQYAHGGGFGFGGGGPGPNIFFSTNGGIFFSAGGFGFGGGGFGAGGGRGYYYGDSGGEESEEGEQEEEEEDEEYYDSGYSRFMYESMFAGNYSGHGAPGRKAYNQYRRHAQEEESPEQFAERLRKNREEQAEAKVRQEREEIRRKEEREREKEEEMAAAAARRSNKKKNQASKKESVRESAKASLQNAQRQAQERRSAVFASARKGENSLVKKGVWEDNVSASGGEFVDGHVPDPVAKEEAREEHGAMEESKVENPRTPVQSQITAPKLGKVETLTNEEKENQAPSSNSAAPPTTVNGSGSPGSEGKKKSKKKKGKGGASLNGPSPPSSQNIPASIPAQNGKTTPSSRSANGTPASQPKSQQQKSTGTNGSNRKKDGPSTKFSKASSSTSSNHAQSAPPPEPDNKVIDPLETLLIIATKNGDVGLAEWLVDHGGLLDERDSSSFTPFHHALSKASLPLLSYFLSIGSPLEHSHPTPPGESFLTLAVRNPSPETVKLVVEFCSAAEVREAWSVVSFKQGKEWEEVKWCLAEAEKVVEGWFAPAGYEKRPRRRAV